MSESNHLPFWRAGCDGMTPRDRRNLNRATALLFGWLVVFAGATLLIRGELVSGPVGWLVAASPILVGLVVLRGYGHYLRHADELQRQIQLRALAVGFGATFFGPHVYRLFEKLGAPAGDVTDVATALVFFYLAGLWWARRQYL